METAFCTLKFFMRNNSNQLCIMVKNTKKNANTEKLLIMTKRDLSLLIMTNRDLSLLIMTNRDL